MLTIVENIQVKTEDDLVPFYRRNPIAYMVDCLDVKEEHVWSKMVEMAESVRDNQKTCVEAGHSVSKDYTAARLALWFLGCFGLTAQL